MIPFPQKTDYLDDILKMEMKNFQYITNIRKLDIYKKCVGEYIYIIIKNKQTIYKLLEIFKLENSLILVNEKIFIETHISLKDIENIFDNEIKIHNFLSVDKHHQ
jgi:hypothetical protein